MAEDVVVQSRPPHRVYGVADLLTDRGVLDSLQQHGGPSGMHPIRKQRVENGAGGGIRVLVEGYVNSGVPAFVNQPDHPRAHAVHRAVEVGDVHRHAASLADLDGLPEGVQKLVSLGITRVSHVEPAQVGDGLGDGHQLVSVAVGPRWIGQAGGETEGPVLHALSGQFLHPVQFRRGGRPVLPAHGLDADGGVGHHERHVACGAAVQKVQELRHGAPASIRRRSAVDGGQENK